MPVGIAATLAATFGAAIGSFLNVVAYRLPRRQSLLRPPSSCPSCATAIRPYDNVPVLGWLLLRGRCRHCREPISARYPLVEALTAGLAVAVALSQSWPARAILGLVLVAALVPITLIDLEHQTIPNRITYPAALVAIGLGALLEPARLPEQLEAGLAATAFFAVFAFAYPRGMGMGDVKLAGVLGLYLGWSAGVAVLVGLLAGTLVGAAVMARLGVARGRKTKVPFGPFLALGGIVALFAGHPILHWYLHAGI